MQSPFRLSVHAVVGIICLAFSLIPYDANENKTPHCSEIHDLDHIATQQNSAKITEISLQTSTDLSQNQTKLIFIDRGIRFSNARHDFEVAQMIQSTIVNPRRVDQRIILKTKEHILKFDTDEFTVKAGALVEIYFENIDFMPHNLLIIKPGSLERVGKAADAMVGDPKAYAKNYVPEIPDVLFYTPIIEIDETHLLRFTVPSEPGDYPFVCTFPGHWRIMNGIMKVEK